MFGVVREKDEDRGRFYMFWNLQPVMGKPVLVGLLSGDSAYSSEQEPEEDVSKQCVEQLRRIYGADKVPDPKHTRVTRWGSDPFARGSYSFVKVGSSGDSYEQLRKPINNRVYFAGEATNKYNPATVPGAYASGLRAAGTIQESISTWDDPFDVHWLKTKQQRKSRGSDDEDFVEEEENDYDDMRGLMSVELFEARRARWKQSYQKMSKKKGIRQIAALWAHSFLDVEQHVELFEKEKQKRDEMSAQVRSEVARSTSLLLQGISVETEQKSFSVRPRESNLTRVGEHKFSVHNVEDRPLKRKKPQRDEDTANLPPLLSFSETKGAVGDSGKKKTKTGADKSRKEEGVVEKYIEKIVHSVTKKKPLSSESFATVIEKMNAKIVGDFRDFKSRQ